MTEPQHSLLRRWLVLGLYAVLLTPLVYLSSLDFFFDSTKAFFVMGLSELLLVGYLWLIYREPKWRPRMDMVTKAFLVFIAATVFVSVLGVDPYLSFWASTDRINGVLWWMHLAVVFFILASMLRNQKEWNRYFATHCAVGLFVGLLFLINLLDRSFLRDSMGGATTGNSTYLGIYLLFSVFFASVLGANGHARWMRRFGWISAAVFALMIFLTSAVAAKGALIGAVVLGLALFTIFSNKPSRVKRTAGIALIVLLTLAFAYAVVTVFRQGSFFNTQFLSFTGGARLEVWKIAWSAFLERPFLGWGLESFPYAFGAHFVPCFGSGGACGDQIWFDRAHNKVLDLLVEGGLALFASYIGLLFVGIWAAWKASFFGRISRPTAILFGTFVAAYFVHNLAEFDVTLTYVFFIVVLAYVSAISASEPPKQTAPLAGRKIVLILSVLATLALPFAFYHSVIFPWQTNQSHQVITAKRMPERLAAYKKMALGSPIGIDYRRVFLAGETAKLVFGLSDQQRTQVETGLREEIKLGIDGLEKTVERAPNSLRAFDLLGLLYQMEGKYYDAASYEQAERVLRDSLALNPDNQQAYWPLASVLLDTGHNEEAFDLLDQAIQLNPEVDDSVFKKLVAMKLTLAPEDFVQQATQAVRVYPSLNSRVDTLLKLKPDDNTDWLYTLFY